MGDFTNNGASCIVVIPKSAAVFGWFGQGIESCGFKAYGGKDSPYVYVDLDGRPSWDVFSEILEKAQVGNQRVRSLGLSFRWRYRVDA